MNTHDLPGRIAAPTAGGGPDRTPVAIMLAAGLLGIPLGGCVHAVPDPISQAAPARADTPVEPAGPRGWLDFADGNVIAGRLVAADTAGGGRFRSDRFGEIGFAAGEARFRPAAGAVPAAPPVAAEATPAGASHTAPPTPPPAGPPPAGDVWRPDRWSLGVSADWKHENDDTEVDLNVELEAGWHRPRDEIELRVRTDYKVRDGKVDNNEQSARLLGFHDLAAPWLVFGQLFIERHDVTVADIKVDYLLWQATLGAGLRQRWGERGTSRAVLGWNLFRVDLLDFHRHVSDDAPSLLLDHDLHLSERVGLTNRLVVYLWRDGPVGLESETEVSYALTQRLSVGLTHRYRKRAVDLKGTAVNEFRLATRFSF